MIIIQPPAHLSSHIKFIWYTTDETNLPIRRVKLIPDGMHGLIFQHSNGNSAISEEKGGLLPVGFVYGQSSAPFVNYVQGAVFTMGIFFRPHAVKEIFKIDADKLSDGFVDLNELAGYNINEVLLNLQNPAKIYEYLSAFIWKKLNDYGRQDMLIEDSFGRIRENICSIDTSGMYKYYNISKRQFQRRFKERAGIHLNTYIRVIKFQASLQLLHERKANKLSDIAYSFGYADQSHFTREFKFFTGHTPKEVINEMVLFPENSLAAHPSLRTRRHIIF